MSQIVRKYLRPRGMSADDGKEEDDDGKWEEMHVLWIFGLWLMPGWDQETAVRSEGTTCTTPAVSVRESQAKNSSSDDAMHANASQRIS